MNTLRGTALICLGAEFWLVSGMQSNMLLGGFLWVGSKYAWNLV